MFIRFVFIALLFAALGCAKTRMQAGTDGATHFLVECDGDADCGVLSCVCGVCSTSCSGDGQCADLNDEAQCLASAPSCETAKSCTLECGGDDDCDALDGARCEAGRCVRPSAPAGNDAGQGGGGGSAGSSGGGGSGGAIAQDGGVCPPALDARSDGTDCAGLVGYTWNGAQCKEVICGCEGEDCERLYGSLRACENANSACIVPCSKMDARSNGTFCAGIAGYSWNGVSCDEVLCGCAGEDCEDLYASASDCDNAHRACTPLTMCGKPADCALASKECCMCEEHTGLDIVAISESRAQDFEARICNASLTCLDCEVDPLSVVRTRYLPQCVSATGWEGGQCTLLDTERFACTSEADCRVRARSCCECNADTSRENLMAVPSDGDAVYNALCEPGQACDECEARYPEDVAAACIDGFCGLLDVVID